MWINQLRNSASILRNHGVVEGHVDFTTVGRLALHTRIACVTLWCEVHLSLKTLNVVAVVTEGRMLLGLSERLPCSPHRIIASIRTILKLTTCTVLKEDLTPLLMRTLIVSTVHRLHLARVPLFTRR